LEFIEAQGLYTGEDLAIIVKKLLTELKLKQKLFIITRDNASNNRTLCEALFNSLVGQFNNKNDPFSTKDRM
jgi:hypothetical protein